MFEKAGVLRIIISYFFCFVFLILTFFMKITKEGQELINNEQPTYFSADELLNSTKEDTVPKTEKPQETAKKEDTSTNSSVSASASAVKGKIISKYISPYSAPSSYNKVYMKNSTSLNIDIKSLLNSSLKFKIKKNEEPQVLIVHTHTTETFMEKESNFYTDEFNSRTTDNNKNMAKIGSIVAEKLNAAGIKTLHDTTKHDYPEYSGSYNRSAKTVNSYLKKYKSIKIVLDLHRDAVSSGSDKVKLVTEINGKKAAQVMLVMGSESGSITNHPNWKENLKLALKLQQTMESKYPTLARPLSLMSKKYNQSLSEGALLIEFGTDVNTLDEACYSAELVADSLVSLLNTLQ